MIMKFILLWFLLLLFSCASSIDNKNYPVITSKELDSWQCSEIYENNFSAIISDTFVSVTNQDTIRWNEVKFLCVNSAFKTKEIMFDQFGKWHVVIEPHHNKGKTLVWENIQLFPEEASKFTIVALGEEYWKGIYASVLVFDQNNQDMLAMNAPYRQKIIDYFANAIRNSKSNDRFFEVYWKTFDPKVWEKKLKDDQVKAEFLKKNKSQRHLFN